MDLHEQMKYGEFPSYEQIRDGILKLIDEGKMSREDAALVLPELRESEDERIRKMLIEQMKNWRRMAAKNCVSEDIKDANAALDWLENHTYPNHLIEDFLLYVLSYGKGGWGEEKQKEQKEIPLRKSLQLATARIGELIEENCRLKESAEWSEEDERNLTDAISAIEHLKNDCDWGYLGVGNDIDNVLNFLGSLPQRFNLQPK